MRARCLRHGVMAIITFAPFVSVCRAQDSVKQSPTKQVDKQVNVNWLYGSPKGSSAPSPRFAAAFGAGVVGGMWKPNNPDLVEEGYRGVISQAGFGFAANWLASLHLTSYVLSR